MSEARELVKQKTAVYKKYCKDNGFKEKPDRLTVEGYRTKAKKVLDKSGGSGIIKNIEIPKSIKSIKGMSEELSSEINNSFERIQKKYDVKIDNIPVKSLGKGFERVPFQFQANSNGGSVSFDIVINSNYDFNGSLEAFQARIMRNHDSGVLAAQSVEDLLWHECVHVMTFQDCNNYREVLARNDILAPLYVMGISGYSDICFDGTESMAEAYIKKLHGYEIPESMEKLLNQYIERWKK